MIPITKKQKLRETIRKYRRAVKDAKEAQQTMLEAEDLAEILLRDLTQQKEELYGDFPQTEKTPSPQREKTNQEEKHLRTLQRSAKETLSQLSLF